MRTQPSIRERLFLALGPRLIGLVVLAVARVRRCA